MRVQYFSVIMIAVSLISCSSADDTQSSKALAQNIDMPAGSVRVQLAKIMDLKGFAKPMVAATKMIPIGWRTQGGIVWQQNTPGCGPNTPHVKWAATAPDGIGMISILPGETWSGHNLQYPGMAQTQCPNVWVTSARQFILNYIQRNRLGAQVLEYYDRQDIVKELQQYILPPQAAQYGMENRQWAEAGQALVSYDVNGLDVRELISIGIIFNLMRMRGVMPGEIQEYLTISTWPGFAVRMVNGRLDVKQVEMFRKSGGISSEWSAKMAQHRAKIAGINAKGAADRARIRSKTNNEISQMQMESWRRQQKSSDYSQREAVEAIRGVETYNNPYNGGTVQLDNSYGNAWQLNDGSYVLSNDPSFDPYAATGESARKLEAAQ